MKRLQAYAQLLRLPNVFTAMADIMLGIAAASALGSDSPGTAAFALLFISSALYLSGMVWNDVFDLEEDRRDRPGRPLPSERIARRTAILLAAGLMLDALLLAAFVPVAGTLPLTAALAGLILAYDSFLKHTSLGPFAMGGCRTLNVLLGTGLVGGLWPWAQRIHLALVVGIYIVGVTLFARTEARMSERGALLRAAIVMGAGLLLALPFPLWFPAGTSSPLFPFLLVAFAVTLARPIHQAITLPKPEQVQRAIKWSILGLIALDALLATTFAGSAGLLILLLLPPGLLLGRWVYST